MTDEETLCEFVIWRLRERDLPDDVAAAALRLADRFPRRHRLGGYLEAAFSVSGINRNSEPSPSVSPSHQCFGRHDALDHADQLILDGWDYVLIDRESRS